MPLYFAYGSNMAEATLRGRCPGAKALTPARLAAHRFVIMANGWASVVHERRSQVHGVLFELALSDIAALDRYEDVAGGLYTKVTQPVVRAGGAPCRALIYVGTEQRLGGRTPPGYMEAIVAAARTSGLPTAYIHELEEFLPHGRQPAILGRAIR